MTYNQLKSVGIALLLGVTGCAHSAGTEPHAMSSADHDQAAERDEAEAAGHEAEYDSEATRGASGCQTGDRGYACWRSRSNPTAEHRRVAERSREDAARHRAASQALRDAEERQCAGLPDGDRDLSPFMHRDDIRSVSPFREERAIGRASTSRTAGAVVVFNAVPGMTAEWLQRVVSCHLARNAAIGFDVASTDMPTCPLTLRGVEATVASVGDGFSVTLRSDDTDTANEVLRRARALTASSE